MLHLQDQVVQLALHGQRPLWGDFQALLWVRGKKKHSSFVLCMAAVIDRAKLCYCSRCSDCISMFRLSEDRVGDICNACVLLVKRWKKLPNGSKKNWNHVSDAPGQHAVLDGPACGAWSWRLFWFRWWTPELDQDLRSQNPRRSKTAMGRRKASSRGFTSWRDKVGCFTRSLFRFWHVWCWRILRRGSTAAF